MLPAVVEEALQLLPVSVGLAIEFRQLLAHPVLLLIEIQHGAVLEKVSPLRLDRLQLDIVAHLPTSAGRRSDSKYCRQGEDGRPEVEGEAVFLQQVEFSSDAVILLEDFHLVTF